MYIVPIAWLYVALMMSVAEATNSNGSLLGALFTFLLYGALPVSIVVYIMGTPARKRALRAREANELARHDASIQPNESSLTTTDAVSAVREEP
jgi:hypothetical protein